MAKGEKGFLDSYKLAAGAYNTGSIGKVLSDSIWIDGDRLIDDVRAELFKCYQTGKSLEDLPQMAKSQASDVEEVTEPIYNKAEKVASEKWLNAKFPSERLFNGHYKSHGSQFGVNTKSEYLHMAAALSAQPISDYILGYDTDTRHVRYDTKENVFALGNVKTGAITTMFKPERGKQYYEEQIRKDLGN